MPGRPLTLTTDLADAICADVAQGIPLEAACESRDVPRATAYMWLQAGREEWSTWPNGDPIGPDAQCVVRYFSDVLVRARASRERDLALAARAAVDEGTKENDIRSRSAINLLRSHPAYRSRWGQHVEVSGRVQQQVIVQQLPPLSWQEARAAYLEAVGEAPALPPPGTPDEVEG